MRKYEFRMQQLVLYSISVFLYIVRKTIISLMIQRGALSAESYGPIQEMTSLVCWQDQKRWRVQVSRYWYHNGCLRPDMLTVFIPIDRCVKENGCLEILPGSHKYGRIEHILKGIQEEADLERVEAIKQQTSLIYVEMDLGDAVFFHCNILHTSGPNNSDMRRWAFLTAYNKATNNPVKKHHHACFTPLIKVPNDAIRKCTVFTDLAGKDFIIPGPNSYIIKPTEEQQ